MKLAVITQHGEIVTAIADLDDYNLDRPIAKADVIQSIQTAITEARALEGTWEASRDRKRLSSSRR